LKTTTIELFKEGMKFSAGHFTIFSATERENMHGHNFTVYVSLTANILGNGMCFDYGIYKKKIMDICRQWNEIFILPAYSQYLKIEETGGYIDAVFNGEKLSFLKRDVLILPVENATIEEFSSVILTKLTSDPDELNRFQIREITVKVFSGPGQCASSGWKRE
jgi:6-pyruvoyltetrahydropterin/6-carboxytetrahydropterin synthase